MVQIIFVTVLNTIITILLTYQAITLNNVDLSGQGCPEEFIWEQFNKEC